MKTNLKRNGILANLLSLSFVLMLSCSDNNKDTVNGYFPIPYPEDGEIITDKWDGNSGYRTIQYNNERHDELLSFYDNYASGRGWKLTETGSGSELSAIYINLHKGYTIDISPPSDQIVGVVVITLWVTE